ncbi:MAG TPA: hypothetical protein VEO19_03865 [Terriglobia bacterium]|nr:hypothetical protein [Terriglobia bacterium]
MALAKDGKQDRDGRLREWRAGPWSTHHSMLVEVIRDLYQSSRSGAAGSSWVAYAGIPLLVSALQSFVIEYECLLSSDRTCLEPLTRGGLAGLREMLETRYRVRGKLLEEAGLLIEVRNEMVHPVPLPTGSSDNCPEYLRPLKEAGLLSSTGRVPDYVFPEQLASHKLFAWSCRVTRDLFAHVAASDAKKYQLWREMVNHITSIGFDADL